jgi:uncharacterized protein
MDAQIAARPTTTRWPPRGERMRIVVVAVTILSNIATLCNLCNAASFECKKANRAVQQMVCSNPELSKLDDEMAMVYSAVFARATAPKSKSSGRTMYSSGLTITTTPEQLRDQQRDWLSTRNKCTDLACVTSAYINQLNILKATIRIPKYDRSGHKSDGQKIIGIDCNKKNKTLEVGYYTAYNLPDNAMDLWDTFSLKTNSNPDNNGNQHVLAVHDVVRECSLGNTHYIVTISAVPGSWSFTGPCGGVEFGRAVIVRNNAIVFDEPFESCNSENIVATVKVREEKAEPTIIRIPRKDYEDEVSRRYIIEKCAIDPRYCPK